MNNGFLKIIICFGFLLLLFGCNKTSKILENDQFQSIMKENGFEVSDTTEINKKYGFENTFRAVKRYTVNYRTRKIDVFYYVYSDNSKLESEFKIYCDLGAELNSKYKKNVMCEWNKDKGGQKGMFFVAGNTSLQIEYDDDQDYDEVLKIVNDLGYSKYLDY